jgi:hypothetical protein
MSRGAVMSLLRGDAQLAELGGTGFIVVPEYEADQRPNGAGAFLVVCWRTVDFVQAIQDNGPKYFDVYAHIPVAVSTDFGRLDALLDRCDDIFRAVEDGPPVDGGDGWQLEQVGFAGRGIDVDDEGYETITKPANYYALSSKTSMNGKAIRNVEGRTRSDRREPRSPSCTGSRRRADRVSRAGAARPVRRREGASGESQGASPR